MYRPKHAPPKQKALPLTSSDCIGFAIEGNYDKIDETTMKWPDLINDKDDKGNTMLHVCCSRGDQMCAELLIRRGADIELQDMYGNTPLLYAVNKDEINIVKMLFKRGASVHACDFRGNSPLHSACAVNNLEMVELLLDRGADPEAQDFSNRRPADRTTSRAIEQSIEIIINFINKKLITSI